MIIMGIDPGVARIGWSVVTVDHAQLLAKSYGCIETEKKENLQQRLLVLHRALQVLFKRFHPDCVSVEEIFFSSNVKTAISVGEARGVILLAAAQHNIPITSYSPSTIKQTICGDGRADKKQMQRMVTRMLHLSKIPTPDDAADALAIALTHAYSYRFKAKIL